VHTSAKAHLTSAAIWRISMSSRFMSINHFPENNPCTQTVIRIATKIFFSLEHCQPSEKFHAKLFGIFLRKVANRQTEKQTTTITYSPWRR